MLKFRVIFGTLMIAGLAGLMYLDERLDQVRLDGTVWQKVFCGRTYLPAGLAMLGAFLGLIAVGTRELVRIFRAKGIYAHSWLVAGAGMAGCLAMYAMPMRLDGQTTAAVLASVTAGVLFAALIEFGRGRRTQGAVAAAGVTMFALVYMGFLPGFFILIRRWHPAWVVVGVILVTKACDIGAYFVGRMAGRHKLVPWLSPGKTWEGLIGGVLTAAATAGVLVAAGEWMQENWGWEVLGRYGREVDPATGLSVRMFQAFRLPMWAAMVGGAVMGLVGQLGDLAASLFKRDAGLKDSADYIPGFGGLLDVVDSPLAVAPLAYWMLNWLATRG